MKFIKAPNNQVRKAGDHNCHNLASETLRLRKNNDSWPRSSVRWAVELLPDCVLQPLALGKDMQGLH